MSDERANEPSPEEPGEHAGAEGAGEGSGDERSSRTIGDRLDELLAEHREDTDQDTGQDVGQDVGADPYDPFAAVPEPESEEEDDTEDGDDLPDAPLFALLRRLEEEITADRIDRVWIFPPRRIEAGETAVVVVAAYAQADPSRRRVYAAHYTALEQNDEHRLAVDEYGTAPSERVGRLVEEVVERIKEGPTGAPKSVRIEGAERRWHETLHELAEEYLETRQGDRRLRR